eukprot:2904176-Rhodomonas_salina.1
MAGMRCAGERGSHAKQRHASGLLREGQPAQHYLAPRMLGSLALAPRMLGSLALAPRMLGSLALLGSSYAR